MKWFRGYKVAAYKGLLKTLGLRGLFRESGTPLDVMKKKKKKKKEKKENHAYALSNVNTVNRRL